jgi:cytochrome b6-f complex iron-sulfur subunit
MEMSRREFVAAAALGACAIGCSSGKGTSTEPGTADAAAAEAKQQGTVDVGTAKDYPTDGAHPAHGATEHVIVVRRGGEIYALSGICTHKACDLEPAGGAIACPCHGSRFDLDGSVRKGPAADALPHYGIAVIGGRLIVDKGQKLRAGDVGAAVKV